MAAAVTAPTNGRPQANTTTHPYTCNTCQVAFKGSALQRGHMQSDWHRYNLKRRVASLPPLTSEVFAEKILANQASAAATAARASFEKVCGICQRTYFSENAYRNHLQSQKHKVREAQLADSLDIETEGETASMISSAFSLGDSVNTIHEAEDEDLRTETTSAPAKEAVSASSMNKNPLPSIKSTESNQSRSSLSEPTKDCLFCNLRSNSIEDNLAHMSKTHGMFIPEQSYLVDLSGLLSYLHDRVHGIRECLYCGQLKHTVSGIQTHMRDKGHCMIAFESEEQMVEVGEFYDFSSTYSDDEEDETTDDDNTVRLRNQSNGSKLGAPRKEAIVNSDDDDEENEDFEDGEWESDEDSEGPDVSGDEAISTQYRPNKNQAYELDGELVLPSGRVAGHRSLARYFRQNLHNYPSPSERFAQQHLLENTASTNDYTANGRHARRARDGKSRELISRAGGGLGLLGASDEKKREADKLELREHKRADRMANRYRAGNEMRGNQQKHFRDPLLQ